MLMKAIPAKVCGALLLSAPLWLSGCATQNDEVSRLAKRQAQSISQSLPLQSAGYTLLLAQNHAATVTMTLTREAQATVAPAVFLQAFQQRLCIDSTIRARLGAGLQYQLVINDTRSGHQYQQVVDRTACGGEKA